jgi:hypothetical protein
MKRGFLLAEASTLTIKKEDWFLASRRSDNEEENFFGARLRIQLGPAVGA